MSGGSTQRSWICMKPTFFSLFKRGRYFHAPGDEDITQEGESRREERERFAVAALAFCLKHDEGFRKHFWEKVCRVPDDPVEMPPVTEHDISIEPPEWADLSLVSNDGVHRFMWVVEAKAGAELQDKQNPNKADFKKAGLGYGALFAASEAEQGTRMRYIVLGANEPLGICDGQETLGITVQERSWDWLRDGVTRTGIVKDLIDTLAELEIGQFYMDKAKQIVVTRGLAGIGDAWTVLKAVCDWLGVHKTKQYFQGQPTEVGGSELWVYCKKPDARSKLSPIHSRLWQVTGAKGWCSAAIGYVSDQTDGIKRSIWLYCGTVQRRDALVKKLETSKLLPYVSARSDSAPCAVVEAPASESPKDFEWFKSVFDAVGIGVS